MPSAARKAKAPSSITAGAVVQLTDAADAMHAALVRRADDLVGCVPGLPEQKALAAIVHALEAYEAQRWPTGVIPGGKG